MDNKQNKTLEALYHYLLKNPTTNINNLAKKLQQNNSDVLKKLHVLKTMGLTISISGQTIKLIDKTQTLDIKSIQAKTKKAVNYFFTTHSTNQLASQQKENAIYLTEYQSAGVGRQGKSWLTPLGQSVALTITHEFDFGLQHLSGLNIAIGVAIIKTARKLGCNNIGVKWPNDVLGAKGKIAGILIAATGNKQNSRAIIGIGINWTVSQHLLDTLDKEGMNIGIDTASRSEFIAELIVEIEEVLLEFSQNKLINLLAIWNKNDLFVNQKIQIIQNHKTLLAKYLYVNQQGQLLVETTNGVKTITSADVSLLKID